MQYDRMKETLFYEKLDNGLQIYVLPKPGFQKTYATFTTLFGSIDNRFQVENGEIHHVPDGIAHFLEHKMFEEPTGDIFATFATQGASANAFTSFDRTTYLFSATERINENIVTLLNFVQNPYFTDENVEKEKGIIGQEITMYQDRPDWRSYFGLIQALYNIHPIKIDIAGTVESISHITKETLYDCYRAFYHPANMILFIVGGIDAGEIVQLISDNQAHKEINPRSEIKRYFDLEPEYVNQKIKVIELPVSLPKWLLGFKELKSGLSGQELLKKELETKVMLDVIFSPSSSLYQHLYEAGLISDQFGYEYQVTSDYGFSIIGGDTKDTEKLEQIIRDSLIEIQKEGISETNFERSRKKKLGAYLRTLNYPEAIANEFTKYRFKDIDFFRVADTYESMTLEDINNRLREHFDWNRSAVSIVRSPI